MIKHSSWIQQLETNSHIGILVVDKDRNILYVNKRTTEMFGYDKETLLATNTEIFHVNQTTFLEFAEIAFNSVLDGKAVDIDFQLQKSDGTLFWAHVSGDAVANEEEVLWTMIDITDSYNANQEVIELKERMELALLGNNDGVWDFNLIDRSIYYSPRWKEIIGYKDNELQNKLSIWEELVHPDDVPAVWDGLDQHLAGKTEYYEGLHRLKHKNGSWVWILSRGKAVYDDNQVAIRMIGTHTDITQEKKLQLRNTQLAQMIEQTHDSVISTDLDGIIQTWNQGSQTLFEYTSKEIIGQDISILFQEKDLQQLKHIIEILMQTGEYNCDIHLLKKSKSIVNVSLSLSLLRDEIGNPISMVGYSKDITKRIEVERKLKEQHQYLQKIIDGVDDPIMVIREDYVVELMNATLKNSLSTMNISNIDEPKCYEISHNRSTPCDGIEHPCPLKNVLESKKHESVIHQHDTIHGKNRFIELSASPLLDKDNNCIGIIEAARDITEHLKVQNTLKEQKSTLHHQAHHDALTQLPNRVLFNNKLENAIKKAKQNSSKVALLFIDLDHFKEINDSLGHAVGDEILKIVASRLQNNTRAKDSISRLGGDEFTLVLEDINMTQDASHIAQKLLESLAEPIDVDDTILYVSSSIGISIYPDDGVTAQNLLKFADSAMYKAKDEGRNNFQYYTSEMTTNAFERVVMETSLRHALEHEEFVVYYQAQVDALTNKIIGMEALVRWQHPSMGLIPPSRFIPLAESTGLIVQLDRFVMGRAMKQISKWYKDGLNPGVLAMNLTAKQLEKKDFISMFSRLMQETNTKAEWIELEVTEGEIMRNPDEAIKILQKISDLGVELAIDDFGTGYSSLAYLKKLPIDKLKIDQAFIKGLPDSEDDASIANAIIALAHSLNLRVIAEGVEKQEQKEFLVKNGCTNIQGYYYSKPIPAQEFEELLKNGFNFEN